MKYIQLVYSALTSGRTVMDHGLDVTEWPFRLSAEYGIFAVFV